MKWKDLVNECPKDEKFNAIKLHFMDNQSLSIQKPKF